MMNKIYYVDCENIANLLKQHTKKFQNVTIKSLADIVIKDVDNHNSLLIFGNNINNIEKIKEAKIIIISDKGEDKDNIYFWQRPICMDELLNFIESCFLSTNIVNINNIYNLDIRAKILINKNNDKKFYLTDKEFALIECLIKNPKIISKEQLLAEIWQYQDNVETHTLETHIYNLRNKINDENGLIETKEGGYYIADLS
jgi:DNA-binding response OmpR family regulator